MVINMLLLGHITIQLEISLLHTYIIAIEYVTVSAKTSLVRTKI